MREELLTAIFNNRGEGTDGREKRSAKTFTGT